MNKKICLSRLLRKYSLPLVMVCCAVLFICSCSTQQRQRTNIPEEQIHYPKIKGYSISLTPVTPRREFYAGEEVNIIFQLRNTGTKKLVIYEWRAKENENVRIYYTPYKKNIKRLPKRQWLSIKPETWGPHATLVLNPRNAVLVSKKLPFIKNISSASLPKTGRNFYLFAELNLKSISARSEVMLITVK